MQVDNQININIPAREIHYDETIFGAHTMQIEMEITEIVWMCLCDHSRRK